MRSSLPDCSSLQGVFMRLPEGCEFADPQPPSSNHFANVFVYHVESSTVFNDDCLCFYDKPQVWSVER